MKNPHVAVMGVAGCGKSVVGGLLAGRLGVPLIEGDDFHPPANIAKMRQGFALDDHDRADWLARLAEELRAHPAGAVLACSALKAAYRARLRQAVPELKFLHLALNEQQALERVASRAGHFYPPSLVATQFQALQDPAGEPGVLVVDATADAGALAAHAAQWLGACPFNHP